MDLSLKDQNYNHLNNCLENLIKVYRALLEVVRKERELLIASNIESLSENNRAKEAMLVKIRSLENQRIKCSRDLAQVIGADTERPRLLEIASHFVGPQGEKLRNAQSVLELLVRRVAEINHENERLVKSALDSITGAMESIRDTLQDKNTYETQGKMSRAPGAVGQLVKREV